ncbi:uncharacterized protein LOC142544956 [Primulina tabacum]|uniref:uncharacterized protein LOC142544956 n=1 Tax=Primulina tabacum TaxID=48773 RepID=UPI003F5A5855
MEHDQQQRLLQFLMGLNDNYMNIRSQILMMSPLPTVGQAFSLLSQEESHIALSSVEAPIAAFYTNQTRGGNAMKERTNLSCDHCSWSGHTKENCYKLVGYSSWHKLYKAPDKGLNKTGYRDNWKGRKISGDANLVVENTTAAQAKPMTGTPSLFTSGQYAEILKLLGSSNVQDECTPAVNMAGPQDWESNGDW